MATLAERRDYLTTRFDFDPEGTAIFGTSASELLRFIRSTRPRPSNEEIEDHVRWLSDEGLVSPADLRALRRRGFEV